MRAVVLEKIGGPDNLTIQEVSTPEPKTGEVRIKILASALNRRDLWITVGLYPGIRLPCVLGTDGAGVVESTGKGVDASLLHKEVIIYPACNWGDNQSAYGPEFRVLGMPDQGTFAEYICVPANDIFPKPEYLSWEQAAAIPVAGLTSWRAVTTQGEVKKGQRVLVTGAGGGVAGFAIQWCVKLGAEVYVSTGSDSKLSWARTIGAVGGVNYHNENCYTELSKKAGGFDVIIDSAGGDTVNQLLASLKPGGRYVFYGATMRNPSYGLEMARLFFRHIRIQGTTMGSPEEFNSMMDFLDKHKIMPVVDRVLPLEKVVEAHKLLENYSQTGKIVLQNQRGT